MIQATVTSFFFIDNEYVSMFIVFEFSTNIQSENSNADAIV
jgi:hypothetical protein